MDFSEEPHRKIDREVFMLAEMMGNVSGGGEGEPIMISGLFGATAVAAAGDGAAPSDEPLPASGSSSPPCSSDGGASSSSSGSDPPPWVFVDGRRVPRCVIEEIEDSHEGSTAASSCPHGPAAASSSRVPRESGSSASPCSEEDEAAGAPSAAPQQPATLRDGDVHDFFIVQKAEEARESTDPPTTATAGAPLPDQALGCTPQQQASPQHPASGGHASWHPTPPPQPPPPVHYAAAPQLWPFPPPTWSPDWQPMLYPASHPLQPHHANSPPLPWNFAYPPWSPHPHVASGHISLDPYWQGQHATYHPQGSSMPYQPPPMQPGRRMATEDDPRTAATTSVAAPAAANLSSVSQAPQSTPGASPEVPVRRAAASVAEGDVVVRLLQQKIESCVSHLRCAVHVALLRYIYLIPYPLSTGTSAISCSEDRPSRLAYVCRTK